MIETGSHHLLAFPVATKRKALDMTRTPGIIVSGTFDECYAAASSLGPDCATPEEIADGAPIMTTDDWVYYILSGRTLPATRFPARMGRRA